MSQEIKTDLRKRILNLLRNQKEEDRLRKSLVILEKLFQLPEFQSSKTILFYASFDGEVETHLMMQRAQKFGKKIALPTIIQDQKKMVPTLTDNLQEDLKRGSYGILEPTPDTAKTVTPQDIDLVIVPGVAFDKTNNRLGRGAGYYDRFLRDLPADTPTVGLAFDFQIVERLPHQKHDIPVSRVITN